MVNSQWAMIKKEFNYQWVILNDQLSLKTYQQRSVLKYNTYPLAKRRFIFFLLVLIGH